MHISQKEAFHILNNLEKYVEKFESARQKKVTPGAMRLIQELLTEASFPDKRTNLH